MKKTLTIYDFREEVAKYSENYKNQFSYEGLEALFNYLERCEEETGEEMEFDFVAICCDFKEYDNLEEIKQNYNNIETIEDLRNETQVIEIEGTDRLIIQVF